MDQQKFAGCVWLANYALAGVCAMLLVRHISGLCYVWILGGGDRDRWECPISGCYGPSLSLDVVQARATLIKLSGAKKKGTDRRTQAEPVDPPGQAGWLSTQDLPIQTYSRM